MLSSISYIISRVFFGTLFILGLIGGAITIATQIAGQSFTDKLLTAIPFLANDTIFYKLGQVDIIWLVSLIGFGILAILVQLSYSRSGLNSIAYKNIPTIFDPMGIAKRLK